MPTRFCRVVLALTLSTLAACGSDSEAAGGASGPAAEAPPTPAPVAEPAPPPPEPAAVAEAYLRAGAASNDADIRASLDPACVDDAHMTRVDSIRVMGVPMTIETLTVAEATRAGDRATVTYQAAGSAHGEGGTMEIFGAQVRTGEVNVENASQSGSLSMRQIEGAWLVSCAAAAAPPAPADAP